MTDTNITPEVINALATLRDTNLNHYGPLWRAVNTLDNAGIFSAIDDATGYDVDPEPVRVSKCTCPDTDYRRLTGNHSAGCPGDPAEWADMAFRTATEATQGSGCACPLHITANTHYTNCPSGPAGQDERNAK